MGNSMSCTTFQNVPLPLIKMSDGRVSRNINAKHRTCVGPGTTLSSEKNTHSLFLSYLHE